MGISKPSTNFFLNNVVQGLTDEMRWYSLVAPPNKKRDGSNDIYGIHHITAIASDPQRNVDFYTSVLGLRLVKLTVNFDDPRTYHIYFGDELGRPGTILTFFPWSSAPKGYRGTGQVVTTSFLIPENSIVYWTSKLKAKNIPFKGPTKRFNAETVKQYMIQTDSN